MTAVSDRKRRKSISATEPKIEAKVESSEKGFTELLFERMKNDPVSRERRTHLASKFGYSLEAWDSLPDETQDELLEQSDVD